MRQHTPGRPYRVDFPEYHVDCAAPACEARALMTESGKAWTAQQAEAHARQWGMDEGEGWSRRGGRWYCPAHVREVLSVLRVDPVADRKKEDKP